MLALFEGRWTCGGSGLSLLNWFDVFLEDRVMENPLLLPSCTSHFVVANWASRQQQHALLKTLETTRAAVGGPVVLAVAVTRVLTLTPFVIIVGVQA